MDDVTFGDLEFLDLATLPLERSKNKNPTMGAYPDIYFNSIATPSGNWLKQALRIPQIVCERAFWGGEMSAK